MLTLFFIAFSLSLAHYSRAICQPFQTSFDSPSTVSNIHDSDPFSSPFVALTPPETYQVLPDKGLELRLLPPQGPVSRQGNVNDRLGEGSTINSTFKLGVGSKVTFQIDTTYQPGAIVAAILIDANDNTERRVCQDEIDLEFVCAETDGFQSNMFAPTDEDPSPHYGAFSGRHKLTEGASTQDSHEYSILFTEDRIGWDVDGVNKRTLWRNDAQIDGIPRWPRDNLLISIGLWDASGAEGTSHWARGPIMWEENSQPIVAHFKRIAVECI